MTENANGTANGSEFTQKEAEIYDRQIRLWGVEAQRRMRNSKVLFLGFNALHAELSKNIVLAGISVTIQDSKAVKASDLAANFFVTASDIGKNRAEASVSNLQELNPLVQVTSVTDTLDDLTDEFLKKYTIVCMTDANLKDQLVMNERCRNQNIPFLLSETYGYDGSLFLDLVNHTYLKAPVKKSNPEAELLEEESKPPVPEEVTINYVPLKDIISTDWEPLNKKKRKRVPEIFYGLRVLQELSKDENKDASGEQILQQLLEQQKLKSDFCDSSKVDAVVVQGVKKNELSPVCAVLGGIIGQEVLKIISRKDKPIENFFFFDGLAASGVVRRIPLQS